MTLIFRGLALFFILLGVGFLFAALTSFGDSIIAAQMGAKTCADLPAMCHMPQSTRITWTIIGVMFLALAAGFWWIGNWMQSTGVTGGAYGTTTAGVTMVAPPGGSPPGGPPTRATVDTGPKTISLSGLPPEEQKRRLEVMRDLGLVTLNAAGLPESTGRQTLDLRSLDPATKLQKLAELRELGLINDDQYDKLKSTVEPQ